MTRIHVPVVAVIVGAIGAILGAASAHEDGFGLMVVMSVIGAAFGLPIGAGFSRLATLIFNSGRVHSPVAVPGGDEGQDRLRKQLDELRDYTPFRDDDYYPGNPDPAWKTPDSRDWTR